ncbi:hypothetical protein LJR220_007071 [Bradyrhizobium sp. LjRoot220]
MQRLPAGTLVVVAKSAGGWAHVSKDGALGYVADTGLAALK